MDKKEIDNKNIKNGTTNPKDVNWDAIRALMDKYKSTKEESEEIKICNKAVKIAESGDLELAIEMMAPLCEKNSPRALNDTGASYERLGNRERDNGNIEKAKEYYEITKSYYVRSSLDLAKENLLKLMLHKKADFDKDLYISTCDDLMERHNETGYLYLSYLYQDDEFGCMNQKEAFDLIERGLKDCEDDEGLIFEYGYLLEAGIGCKKDNFKSHLVYESLLETTDLAVVLYNYGLQCRQGRGCEKDEKLAIRYLSMAAERGYRDAVKELMSLYKDLLKRDTKKNQNFITED